MSWLSTLKTAAKYTNPFIYAADQVKDTTQGIVGSRDVIPGVNNPFNNTTDGYVDTSGMTSAPAFNVRDSGFRGSTYYDSANGQMMEWTGSGYRPATANDPNSNPTTSNYSSGVLGRNTGSSGPSYDPAQLAQYDQAIGLVNDNLGRINTQRDIALGNVGRQYGVGLNELNSAKSAAQNTRDTQSTQNRQSFVTDRNAINDQYSQGLRGLLRTLGAFGAGGSDFQLAGNAAADVASMQRSGSGQTYAQNQQGIDTSWGNFLTDDKNERDKLQDWRTTQENSVKQQALSNRQNLLQKLAELQGARSEFMGGGFAGGAQPYLDQARGLNSEIDALSRFNPQYSGNRPVYQQASLDSYNVGAGPQAVFNTQAPANSPFRPYVLGTEEERR